MKKFLFILMAFLLIGGFVFAAGEQEKEVEGIVLTVAMHAPDIPEETEAFVNLFASEHPHITVDFTSIRNIDEYLQPKAAAGLMPDFVSINSGSFGADLADRGILADLSNTEAAKNTLDSVKPQYTSPGGKLYGIAGGIASSLIYYNKE
ncbi:MAG: carbohydrate ABC transporter substrate-binding protein, partial [Spirochaetales bacterium]|nr:carbohydrate ABC transporter substrate-binding protein [Spirochaetales bacterium]